MFSAVKFLSMLLMQTANLLSYHILVTQFGSRMAALYVRAERYASAIANIAGWPGMNYCTGAKVEK